MARAGLSRSVFRIPKMDCPAEEQLVRMALEGLSGSDSDLVRQTARDTIAAARERLRLWGLKPEQIRAVEQTQKPTDRITIHAYLPGAAGSAEIYRREAV